MRRPLPIRLILVVVVVVGALIALSRMDATRTPHTIVVPVPDNALAH